MLPHRYEPVPSAPTDTLDAPEPECALDDRGTDSPRSHDESCEDNNEEDGLSFALVPVQHRYWSRHRTRTSRTSSSHPILTTVVLISFMTSLSLFMTFPFPTTIHLFVGMAFGLASWIAIAWVQQALVVRATIETMRRHPRGTLAPSLISTLFKWLVQCRWATLRFGSLLVGTGIVFSGLCLGVIPSTEHVPYVPRYGAGGTKSFIAATLHNNESLLPHWSKQLLHLVHHLGPSHTFVSIFESDSEDSTPKLLAKLGEELSGNGVKHRIITEKTSSPVWGYPSSPVRIKYLSDARNKAMEPLQSNDSTVRLEDYDSYTKVVFLGDVIFSWQSVVRLLATRLDHDHHHGESGNYDLACGMDFTSTGLYDTWTARDVCGTPMRNSWPYVKDLYSAHRLRKGKTIPVSACWNGMVAFPAGPYLYQPNFTKRGWKMIDSATYDEEDLATSPPLTTPLMFRSSGVDACDHSERFLFSYDIHRLHSNPKRPARIIMNPEVRTAYDWRWYAWENYVLRIPVVDWWRYYWSHGWPNVAVDWISEVLDRRRDYCTWSALVNNAPERCPPLPAAVNRKWDS